MALVCTAGQAAVINVELTSRGLGIGTSDYNYGKDGDPADADVAGKIVIEGAPGSGLGSKLTVQTNGLAGAGTVPNPLLMTVTAKSHLDNTGVLPADFQAGIICLSEGDGVAPIVYKDEGLGVRTFTVDETTGVRLFSSGLPRIEGSKDVSGGTDVTSFATRGNGPPHVDESVLFDFNPGVAVLAASTSFLLTKFESTDKINLVVKLSNGTVIDTPVDATHQLGVTPADAPALLTVFGPSGDKVYRLNISALAGITANTLLDSVTIRAVDDNPASPSGTAEHFLINGMVTTTTDLPTIGVSLPLSGLCIVGCGPDVGATVTNTTAGLGALDYSISAAITQGGGTLGTATPAGGTLNPGQNQAHTATLLGNIGLNQVTFTVTSPQASNSPQTIVSNQTVLDHSDAQFQEAVTPGDGTKTFLSSNNELTIDFGSVVQGSGNLTSFFDILAAITTAGFTAGLDLDNIVPVLTDPAFSLLGSSGFTNQTAGATENYSVAFDTSGLGFFTASWQLLFSDQDLSCATAPGSEPLLLTVTGTTTAPPDDTPNVEAVPEPSTMALGLLGLIGLGMTIARRRRRTSAAG